MLKPPAIVRPFMQMTQAEKEAVASWKAVKETSGKTRQAWLGFGKALKKVRVQFKSDNEYNARLKELGLDQSSSEERSNAIWMSENEAGLISIQTTIVSPTAIRAEHRAIEQRKAALEQAKLDRAELDKIAPIRPQDAKRYKNSVERAADEASAPAEKAMAEKQAKKILDRYTGVKPETIVKAAETYEKVKEWRGKIAQGMKVRRGVTLAEVSRNYDDMSKADFIDWLAPYINKGE